VFYKLNSSNTFALALLPNNNLVVSRNLWIPPGNFLLQPPLFRDGSMGALGTEPAHPLHCWAFLGNNYVGYYTKLWFLESL